MRNALVNIDLVSETKEGNSWLNFAINNSLWLQIPCSKTTNEEFTHGKLQETVVLLSSSSLLWQSALWHVPNDVVVSLGLTSSEKWQHFGVWMTRTWYVCSAWWSEIIIAVTQCHVSWRSTCSMVIWNSIFSGTVLRIARRSLMDPLLPAWLLLTHSGLCRYYPPCAPPPGITASGRVLFLAATHWSFRIPWMLCNQCSLYVICSICHSVILRVELLQN